MKFHTIKVFSVILILIIISFLCGHAEVSIIPRITIDEFVKTFSDVFVAEKNDSAGFAAMDLLGRDYEKKPIEIIGQITWDRPFDIKAESKEKPVLEVTYGDLYIQTDSITFQLNDKMNIYFLKDFIPYIGPELTEYGLEEKASRECFPLRLPREFIVVLEGDTLKSYTEVIVRGYVSIDWAEGFNRKRNPMESISFKDCRIVGIIHPPKE